MKSIKERPVISRPKTNELDRRKVNKERNIFFPLSTKIKDDQIK